jgi:hypothetical protein
VAAFEKAGCSVADMTKTGLDGFPDVLVGCGGVDHKVEFKDPTTRYGKKGLAQGQSDWSANWKGEPVYCVDSVDGVITLVNWWRTKGMTVIQVEARS